MRKIITVLSILILLLSSRETSAQTLEQMQQLQGLSADQIAQFQKMKEEGDQQRLQGVGSIGEVNRIGDKTTRERTPFEEPIDSTIRLRIGGELLPEKYEHLFREPGDSIILTKEEYVELKMRKDKDSLTVYGREIFDKENLTFAPSINIPTPINYIIASGDMLIIHVWGAADAEYELKVSPEGDIRIPDIGVVNVGGLSITEATSKIKAKFITAVSGLNDGTTNLKITLGDIRSINVNIVGEAKTPGSYTLPSLATVFNAIYAAGGVSDIGSLRNIKLYRGGKLVTTLDVYDYLIKGRSNVDKRLEDNDVIVVAPYENIVTITGKIKRPKLYELKKKETIDYLVNIAGGFTGDAYTQSLGVIRRSGGRQFSMHTVRPDDFGNFTLADRDSINVGAIIETFANRVSVEGAVWKEGNFELSDSVTTVGGLVRIAEGLSDDAFGGRAQIVRTRLDKSLEIISVNINRILMGTAPDIELQKDDRLIVTSINDMKEGETITIKGEVNDPQTMPYAGGMTFEDLIVLAKGLKGSASLARIDIARRVKSPHSTTAGDSRAELFTFAIPENLEISEEMAKFTLMPYDEVYVRRSPGYREQESVFIRGEVNFGGEYTLSSVSNKLTDLIKYAGGVTSEAYPKGASLQRQVTEMSLRRTESLMKLSEVANKSRSAADSSITIDSIRIGDYFVVGIDLVAAIANPSSSANLILRKGDILYLPTIDNTVTISGAVFYPTTTTYDETLKPRHYIKKAGGYSSDAQRKPFIIYMNGNVSLAGSAGAKIEPGCEIVVPYKERREPMSVQGWVGISTSVVSMAAMIMSLLTTTT